MSESKNAGKKPTKEQEEAISAAVYEPSVVSAAAGTGKTTMLVERVLRLISDTENPVRADSLVILTFTVNATQNMRDKLTSALAKRIEELEDVSERDFLAEQSSRLRNACISTINSFCLGIIRDNIEKFDLPVNVAIADETKIASMKTDAVELAKKDFYTGDTFSEDERKLLFYSFDFEDDKALFDTVVFAQDKLSSYADSEKWLKDAVSAYDGMDTLIEAYMPVYTAFAQEQYDRALHYHEKLSECYKNYNAQYETEADKKKKEKKQNVLNSMSDYLDCLSNIEKLLSDFLNAPTLENLEKLTVAAQLGSPKLGREDPKSDAKKAFTLNKNYADTVFDELGKIACSKAEEENNLSHNRTVISAFVKLLKIYEKYFRDIKRSAGYIDFSDCELLLLDKLKNDDGFRELLSKKFSCVIVDEFQDCNDVQAEIFRLMGKDRQFYVGDIKQSIYAFRGGDPEIMAGLCKGEYGFKEYLLTKNFRSRQSVINTVNDAFSGLMTEEHGGVDYGEKTKLVYGADYPDAEDNSVYDSEIYSVNSKEQPQFVARKIQELMNDENFKITKNKELCRPNYSDFAILMRNNKKSAEYREALSQLGISSVVSSGKNILESEEAAMLVSYLKVIDNPLCDKELLHILMSPLYGMTADEAAKMKLGTLGLSDKLKDEETKDISENLRNYALYECLKFCTTEKNNPSEYTSEKKQKAEECERKLYEKGEKRKINEKALAAERDIERFRRFMSNNSVVDLIRKICAETDIYSVICALDESAKRTANLRLFERTAEDFVARDGGTLCDFLRFLKRSGETQRGEIEEASVPEDAANSVRIMTFHASKGLEIPVCILAELQTAFSNKDYSGKFLINHDKYFSINYVDRDARFKSDTFAHKALGLLNKKKPVGEELRLLYVAMTRAMEKLIMVGNFKDEEDVPTFLPDFYSGTIPFKWILRKLIEKGYKTTAVTNIKAEEKAISAAPETEEGVDITENELKEIIDKKYPNEAETVRRIKYSVTELAHRNEPMPFVLTKPKFAAKSEVLGTDVGNAYHHTMEHISLSAVRSSSDMNAAVKEAVSELCKTGKLTEEERLLVNSERIVKFFKGDLGQRMLNSRRIERERSFYAEISGSDIPDIGENAAIQGQIDMFFEEDDGIVIVDYKSDSKENLIKEKENYSLQVKIYAAVAPKLFGKPVKEIYLYSFANGEAVKV